MSIQTTMIKKKKKFPKGFTECAASLRAKDEILIRLQLSKSQLRKLGKWFQFDRDTRSLIDYEDR